MDRMHVFLAYIQYRVPLQDSVARGMQHWGERENAAFTLNLGGVYGD